MPENLVVVPLSAPQVLDREFLEIRAKILEIAASLDRIDRGGGSVEGDRRFSLLRQGIEILSQEDLGRAERLQQLFSREFDTQWRSSFGI